MVKYNDVIRLKEKLGVPEETVEKDYLIELLLSYISNNRFFKNHLIFRGGTALKKIFFPDFRHSEDLDFIVKPGADLISFRHHLNKIVDEINEEWPVALSMGEIIYPQEGHLQLFISYNIVPEIRVIKKLKLDFVKDSAILESRLRKILFTFKDFVNLVRYLNVYNLESIAAEKILRIIDVVDEPRDLWDLRYLLKSKLNSELIRKAFREKVGYDINYVDLIRAIKKPNYEHLWQVRLKSQIPSLPEYCVVVDELESLIKRFF
ncbi:hypothetical protein DRP53_07085 [candidate division WOR-3 bacterium]|uniref:Nucleotidyl transferase AbiEii/AbiGii toxin family protein n=1 Tax=candidate division WOR-3 bacterium TaxID=2052148 RepID=A0A660SGW3_UNCW3|nr:MAG: hypothetical protein DRP53_07085 [candidate division WOR-3 bacterium]